MAQSTAEIPACVAGEGNDKGGVAPDVLGQRRPDDGAEGKARCSGGGEESVSIYVAEGRTGRGGGTGNAPDDIGSDGEGNDFLGHAKVDHAFCGSAGRKGGGERGVESEEAHNERKKPAVGQRPVVGVVGVIGTIPIDDEGGVRLWGGDRRQQAARA